MGIFDGFVDAAKGKLDDFTGRYNAMPNDTSNTVGSSIFEAIYQYGRGEYDAARAKVATAILETSQGQKVVAEVEKQRLKEYIPWIIGAIILTLGGVLLLRR
jgi:hypothetical protein